MYATRRCTHGVPTVYAYPQYPWLTQPEGRWVRVLTGTGTGQPGITRGLPVLIPSHNVPDTVTVSDKYVGRSCSGENKHRGEPKCAERSPRWGKKVPKHR